jgi:hypothetical protein
LNEGVPLRKSLPPQPLTTHASPLSAHCQQLGGTQGRGLTIADIQLERILQTWPQLSCDTRSVVEALCLYQPPCDSSATISPTHGTNVPAGNLELAEVVACWAELSPHIRQALLTLIRLPRFDATSADGAGGDV